jgi:predicted dienelactone hydrolase
MHAAVSPCPPQTCRTSGASRPRALPRTLRAAALLASLALAACAGGGRSGETGETGARVSAAFDAAANASASDTLAGGPQGAPVRSVELEWHDASRDRGVPVRLYLPDPPAEAVPAAGAADLAPPLPLVVFSHGLGGSRAGYSHLGRHWAGQGYASLHLQHAGSDRAVWRNAAGLEMLQALQSAASPENAVARARDVSFALDTLLADPVLGPRIDRRRIAVAGHSYGANTALLVSGARFEAQGLPQTLRDERIRAAILMSAPPFPASFDSRRVLAGVTIPTLHLTTVDDVIRVPGYWSVAQDRIDLFEALPAAPKRLAVFGFGAHSVFTDRGSDPRTLAVKRASRDLTTAFLQDSLDGRALVLDRAFAANAALFTLTGGRTPAAAGTASLAR